MILSLDIKEKRNLLTKVNARIGLIAILAIYLFLVLAYGAVNPIYEAPDEYHHFFAIKTIADFGKLPSTKDGISYLAGQESAQPPLYYLAAALLIFPLDLSGAEDALWFNPAVQMGNTDSIGNTNVFVHTSNEGWPWKDYVLAVHIVRAFSSLLGLATLLLIYSSARMVWPDKASIAYIATMLVAILPQFSFLHASISNDPLIIFFSTAAIWQLLRMWNRGINSISIILLGLTVGLAILSKVTGILLLVYALIFIAVMVWRNNRYKGSSLVGGMAKYMVMVLVPVAAISGWLFWRNWKLYGDVTATSEFVRLAGGARSASFLQVLENSLKLWDSIFAIFGWLNIGAPEWVYWIWSGLILLSTSFIIFHLIRARVTSNIQSCKVTLNSPLALMILLISWGLLVYAGLLLFMLRTPGAQGRLLFPAMLPLALVIAYGLSLVRPRWILAAVLVLASFTSIYSIVHVIPNAFRQPPIIEVSNIPASANRLDTYLGQGLELTAAHVETETATPGESVWLTLYWQALNIPDRFESSTAPRYVVEGLGQEDEIVGKLQSYPGNGLFPSVLWPSEMIVVDRLAMPLKEDSKTPARIRLNVKLAGEFSSVDAGFVKIVPPSWPEPTNDVAAVFNGIELVGTDLPANTAVSGETIDVNVRWQVIEDPGRDLTTFIHLGDPSREPLAQGDRPPLNGHYPTSLWSAGEVIDDYYNLIIPPELPPGRYPIHLGLYDPQSGTRIPLYINGQPQPDGVYFVGWLKVLKDS